MRVRSFVLLLLTIGALGACAPRGTPPGDGGGDSEPPGPIAFVLDDTYRAGSTVDVKIANLGSETYVYNEMYEACDLTYTDGSGRQFLIPPGTHCDLVMMSELKPGETATLFRWRLDECIRDEWGCVESEPLPPGDYTIEGRFHPRDGGPPVPAEATFRVVEA